MAASSSVPRQPDRAPAVRGRATHPFPGASLMPLTGGFEDAPAACYVRPWRSGPGGVLLSSAVQSSWSSPAPPWSPTPVPPLTLAAASRVRRHRGRSAVSSRQQRSRSYFRMQRHRRSQAPILSTSRQARRISRSSHRPLTLAARHLTTPPSAQRAPFLRIVLPAVGASTMPGRCSRLGPSSKLTGIDLDSRAWAPRPAGIVESRAGRGGLR